VKVKKSDFYLALGGEVSSAIVGKVVPVVGEERKVPHVEARIADAVVGVVVVAETVVANAIF
jgi:hypothetical protein